MNQFTTYVGNRAAVVWCAKCNAGVERVEFSSADRGSLVAYCHGENEMVSIPEVRDRAAVQVTVFEPTEE